MLIESLNISGRIAWSLERNGVVIQAGERDNVITAGGKQAIAALLASGGTSAIFATHIGFGTSNTPVTAADTALGAELSGSGYARAAVTRSNPSTNVSQFKATLTGLTAGATVNEVGLFDAVTGGKLLAHQLTGAVPLAGAEDSLTLTWQITVN